MGPRTQNCYVAEEVGFEPRHNPSAQTPKLCPMLTPESVYSHTKWIGGECMSNMHLEARTKENLQEHLWVGPLMHSTSGNKTVGTVGIVL